MARRRPKSWPDMMKAECRIDPEDEQELILEAVMWKASPAANRWLICRNMSPDERASFDRTKRETDLKVAELSTEPDWQAESDERRAAFEAWFAADPERAAEIMRRVEQLEQAAREASA